MKLARVQHGHDIERADASKSPKLPLSDVSERRDGRRALDQLEPDSFKYNDHVARGVMALLVAALLAARTAPGADATRRARRIASPITGAQVVLVNSGRFRVEPLSSTLTARHRGSLLQCL